MNYQVSGQTRTAKKRASPKTFKEPEVESLKDIKEFEEPILT